jgi:hypothetical protein
MGSVNVKLLRCLVLAATVGAVAMANTGCQTRIGGVPYPTPHYLKHTPVYFPPDPPFSHQRERDSMIDPTGELRRGGAAVAPPLGAAPENLEQPVPR